MPYSLAPQPSKELTPIYTSMLSGEIGVRVVERAEPMVAIDIDIWRTHQFLAEHFNAVI